MELSLSGTKVPGIFRSRERKFHGTFVPGSECSWERKFLLPQKSHAHENVGNSAVGVVREPENFQGTHM